jgi:hypothetical protein
LQEVELVTKFGSLRNLLNMQMKYKIWRLLDRV